MKQKLHLLIATFLLLSFFSMSQSIHEKQPDGYFEQNGIKKKISELREVKSRAANQPKSLVVKPYRSYFKRFQSTPPKPEKEEFDLGSIKQGDDDEADSKNARRAAPTVSSTVGQPAWSNFLSLDFYDNPFGWPPDPNGAVGGTQVIVASNGGIKVYDKPAVTDPPIVTSKGYSREEARSTLFIPIDKFFSPVLPATSSFSDPHIRYDRLSKRWFIVAIEVNPLQQNNLILLAVSDGDRVTDSSSFTYYAFKSALSTFDDAALLDFPRLGVDKHSVLIGGNQFGNDSVTNIGYVIDKQKLIHGKLVVHGFELGVYNFGTGIASGVYTPQGVNNDDPSGRKSFFAGISYYQDQIIIANIEYDKKNKPKLASESIVPVEAFTFPRQNTAPGGLVSLNLNDTRLLEASIYKNKLTGNSSLWTAHAIGIGQSGKMVTGSDSDVVRELRTGSRWYKIGHIYDKPYLVQSGTIHDASEPSGRRAKQYFNPSVAASGQGHSIVSGTTDAYNEYLNVFAAGRYSGDPLGKTRALEKLTNTTAIYAPYNFDALGNKYYVDKWGDFSQTVVDPEDDQTIWTFQEYANVDDSYGVRVVQFKAPPPATPASVGTLSNKNDTTITLEGTSVNNSGFFDPGKDINGPGYKRLSVKSTGSIIIRNIKFISPTKISFTLNTKNKPAGQYLLIISNPDGQLVATDYTIAANTPTLIAGSNSSEQKALQSKLAQTYISACELFPNPTVEDVTLKINAAQRHTATIAIVDASGKQLFQKTYNFSKGTNQAVLPTQKFSKGTYIAIVYNSDNFITTTQKFVKQ